MNTTVTDEGPTVEQLSATSIVEYHDPGERLDALRAAIKAAGVSSTAQASGVSRSQVKAIVNRGKRPHAATVEKLGAALQ